MSKFIGEIVIEQHPNGKTAWVRDSFVYQSDLLARNIVIPPNFRTDGASVPQLFWNLIPPWGEYGAAAIVHDYLYRWQYFSRKTCDEVLLEAMKSSGCNWILRQTIYRAVRLGGAGAWAKDKQTPLSAKELEPNQ